MSLVIWLAPVRRRNLLHVKFSIKSYNRRQLTLNCLRNGHVNNSGKLAKISEKDTKKLEIRHGCLEIGILSETEKHRALNGELETPHLGKLP